jgi:ethanolamine utilization protein EutJ
LAHAKIAPGEFLDLARAVLLTPDESARAAAISPPEGPLYVGVDLGTAYVVVSVLDAEGLPIAGEYRFAQVSRDGLVVDYFGAVEIVRGMKSRLERRIGRTLTHAASGYPPGVPQAEVRATANVVEAAGLHCTGLVDEPSAANLILALEDGVIIDVGGGTTGVAVIQDGKVVYTADEATGGTHFSLVIAGALGVTFEEAERLKQDPQEQQRLFPMVRPVMEKVGSIIARHVRSFEVEQLTLVGGSCAFPGFADVVSNYTSLPATVAPHPMFVTPLGIAMNNRENMKKQE